MKKALSILSAFVLLVVLAPSASAYNGSVTLDGGQTIYFNINYSNNTIEITCPDYNNGGWGSYTKPTGALVIPDSITYNNGWNDNTYPVTAIGSSAFSGCNELTSITIPEGVTTIGYFAFYNCSGLTSVTISDGVTSIGNHAFLGCSGLTSITIPRSVTSLGWYTFEGCNLTSVVFNADSCTYADSPFAAGNNITSFTIGDNVKCIPAKLCYGGCYMTTITIPDSINYIGDEAFRGCSLTSVTIGNGVTSIGNDAFLNCSNLTSVTIGDNTLTVASSNTSMGSPNLELPEANSWNHSVYVHANPMPHYHLTAWSNGSTYYDFDTIPTSNITLTASYAIDRYGIRVYVYDTTLGSVALPLGDSADYGDTLMVVATPIAHYHVNYWEGSDIVATSADKDTIWVKMTQDERITCRFAIDVHTVSVAPSDIVRGSVSTTGTEFEYGQPCTVEATAYTGYTFQSWSNGVTANPYTFAVTADVELTAIFLAPGEETYTVTVSVNDPTMGTATVNGNATATVTGGTEVTLTATANQGYRFVRWNDDNTEATRTVTVTSDMSFTAYFESIEGIDEADGQAVVIYAADGSIHIDATQPAEAAIYDMMGRHLATVATGTRTPMPTGVYMVKVGTLPAKKVVVVR